MATESPKVWECEICGYEYDEEKEGVSWADLPDDWECPICGAGKEQFQSSQPSPTQSSPGSASPPASDYLSEWSKSSDAREPYMADIHHMAATGESITEAMNCPTAGAYWNDILIKGAQLARMPLNEDEAVNTQTVIGPNARSPLIIDMPVFVSHMSFGALSREVKIALAKGSAEAGTAMCSGEGGILPESLAAAHKYIFEYVPNLYSVTEENLRAVDAVEIKIGQSAKPGLGGHLPGDKVTEEISKVRGFPVGQDIISPSRFKEVNNKEQLRDLVAMLRDQSGGKPVGIKMAAGDIEADLDAALFAEPDFVTIDGRPGATGAAPKFVKSATSVPTVFAIRRARKHLDKRGATNVSLITTGGLRTSADFAKALALGADAIGIATAALMACGCQQYRMCHTGKCPVGIATQDPDLRARLKIDESARRLANYLSVCNKELKRFARLTGHADIQDLALSDLCTVNGELSNYAGLDHV